MNEKELREKIDQVLQEEMITIGTSVEDAKTGQMWAFDSERLSKKILTIVKEAGYLSLLAEERQRLTVCKQKLDEVQGVLRKLEVIE